MDADEASGSHAPDTKRQKRNDEGGPSGIAAIGTPYPAEVAAIEQKGDIFKLDIDCYEEAFDYLPIEDLAAVGKTCKRLQQVAGYCFQQNYAGIAACSLTGIRRYHYGVDIKHFSPFIQEIVIKSDGFQRFIDSQSEFKRLKQIRICGLKTTEMNRLKEIALGRMEVLDMYAVDLGNNFHEIIAQCVKLSRFKISYCNGEYNWFARKYPTLEYFKIVPVRLEDFPDFLMFLELNPNIRKFATTSLLLWKHRGAIMTSKVKLYDLAIEVDCFDIYKLKSLCEGFNALHERGFYKKIQLYFIDVEVMQEDIDQLATLNGLVKLHVNYTIDPLEFSALKSLEELSVDDSDVVADLEVLPNELINLKRIHFGEARIDDIIPFIRQSVKMQKIRVDDLYFNEDIAVIDLRALNKEREQLALNTQREQFSEVEKITLYVEEEVYLATKWALGETDFGLIRLKRKRSFEWNHDF